MTGDGSDDGHEPTASRLTAPVDYAGDRYTNPFHTNHTNTIAAAAPASLDRRSEILALIGP